MLRLGLGMGISGRGGSAFRKFLRLPGTAGNHVSGTANRPAVSTSVVATWEFESEWEDITPSTTCSLGGHMSALANGIMVYKYSYQTYQVWGGNASVSIPSGIKSGMSATAKFLRVTWTLGVNMVVEYSADGVSWSTASTTTSAAITAATSLPSATGMAWSVGSVPYATASMPLLADVRRMTISYDGTTAIDYDPNATSPIGTLNTSGSPAAEIITS